MTNPKIRKAAVIGIPDEDAGELPMAFVVRQIDANITEQEVIDHVKSKNGIITPFNQFN